MRITNSMMSRHSLTDITSNSSKLDRAMRELSSQKRILQASDDPIGTQRAMNARSELAATAQYTSNIDAATGQLQTTDSAMDEVTKLLQRARELTVQAASDTTDQASRENIALEIDQIASQLKTAGNTTYAGIYLFAGTATTTKPYDTTTIPPNDTYSGNPGAVAREIGPGVSVQVNIVLGAGSPPILGAGGGANAATGLTTGDGGLLSTMRTLADNLRSGTAVGSNALKTSDLNALDANLDSISSARATIGATLNRLSAASDRLAANKEASSGLLSRTEDVDFAQATINYSTQQTVYQASLSVGAKIIQPSLLDFLG
jgi:flagellar hook-associated protein 3 FlgL